MGPVMLDLEGDWPSAQEWQRLDHPWVGGVILFTRNFSGLERLRELTAALHVRKPGLLVAVDHEGGRIQRFRTGFTALPAMAQLGRCHDHDPVRALEWARAVGAVLAWELRLQGVDLSFTPVLDLDYGTSRVIGERAFHRKPEVVSALAQALCEGLGEAGMGAVGKHFPGHGYVSADSHLDLPVDGRARAEIWGADLQPFRALIAAGLAGIMPAHVVYPALDESPAGFSSFWLTQVLRQELGFTGLIFSDDLSMQGAVAQGSPGQRAVAALAAGCDMVLICNDPAGSEQLLAELERRNDPIPLVSSPRARRLCPPPLRDEARAQLKAQQARDRLSNFGRCPG